ncbi:alpha/beta hydrolase [Alkalicoccus chagannorensis]|uniref:alpha/beta hydrolase n=1 Tax=Alkalicoccus chagannorensis TaxID=427072 RepID=UPI0003F56110|nr:alpha/beta hydrolase [Alkalicoccus chagannorensis]
MWHWEAEGEAKAVIVLVHGAGEYHGRYERTIDMMRQQQFHVVMGDLPGQGTTPGPRGHVETFQQYIQQVRTWVLQAGAYDLPVILFGHSMGGLISTEVVRSMPERERPDMLLLSSPCFGLVQQQPLVKRAAAGLLAKVAPRTMFPNGLESGSGTRDDWMRTRDQTDDLLIKKVSARWYKELVTAMARAHEEASVMPEIPIYVTQGGEDRIVDKKEVRRWFDAVPVLEKAYKEWPGLYHEVLNEPEREAVLTHLLGYVTTQLAVQRFSTTVTKGAALR